MTPRVIAAGMNLRGPGARHLPNGHLLAPECTLTLARMHRVAHPKPPDRDEWPRFRSMLDCATVFDGWEESSGKSRIVSLSQNGDWLDSGNLTEQPQRAAASVGSSTELTTEIKRAVRLQQAGDLACAEALYRQVLEAEPDNPDALHLMGVLYHQKGATALGVGYIERALMLRPDSALFHRNLGNLLRTLRRLDEAAEHLRRVVELGPDDARAHGNLADLLAQDGRLDEAERHYRTALDLDPDNGLAHNRLGNVLRECERLDDALVHCERALELAPDDAASHSDLGRVLQELRRLDEALAAYRRAVLLEPRLYRSVMKNIARASAGRLWLHPSALRRILGHSSNVGDPDSDAGPNSPSP